MKGGLYEYPNSISGGKRIFVHEKPERGCGGQYGILAIFQKIFASEGHVRFQVETARKLVGKIFSVHAVFKWNSCNYQHGQIRGYSATV